MGNELVNVNVLVNGVSKPVQMEQGVMFKNNGGTYRVSDDGSLKFQKTGTNVWTDAKSIEMKRYQWQAFQNVANNDGNSSTYTKEDIEKAQELYRQGNFKTDMSKDLPAGYHVNNPSKKDGEYVEAYVNNGKSDQSATLRFSIAQPGAAEATQQSQKPAQKTEIKTNHNVRTVTDKNGDKYLRIEGVAVPGNSKITYGGHAYLDSHRNNVKTNENIVYIDDSGYPNKRTYSSKTGLSFDKALPKFEPCELNSLRYIAGLSGGKKDNKVTKEDLAVLKEKMNDKEFLNDFNTALTDMYNEQYGNGLYVAPYYDVRIKEVTDNSVKLDVHVIPQYGHREGHDTQVGSLTLTLGVDAAQEMQNEIDKETPWYKRALKTIGII